MILHEFQDFTQVHYLSQALFGKKIVEKCGSQQLDCKKFELLDSTIHTHREDAKLEMHLLYYFIISFFLIIILS